MRAPAAILDRRSSTSTRKARHVFYRRSLSPAASHRRVHRRRRDRRAAGRRHQGRQRRGHHRVPARERPTVLLFPDASKPTMTVNVTYLVGSRHEGYGETGMAHLLEHMVFKGTPRSPSVFAGARPARHAHSTASPRTTAPTTSRRSPRATRTSTGRSSWRPTGWSTRSIVQQADLDTEMTVVRNEFESGENNPQQRAVRSGWRPSRSTGTTTASSTIGARSDIENVPHREAAGVLPQVLPAGQRRADRSPASSTPTARSRLIAQDVRRRFRGRRGRCRSSTPWSRCRTASARSRVRRVGDAQWLGAMYHLPHGRASGRDRRPRRSPRS